MTFFAWGYIVNEVYFHPLTSQENCKQQVRDAFNTLSTECIQSTINDSVLSRITKCLEVQGRNFK